ncbi:MAG: SPASM domain-containing protein [Methanobrevibacter sp.]|uniref:SPASM domain-containing protein n=1 Tax=Methanobrevibacter sp. TaxID=66852 RepID=UPI0025F560A3|nr:SPASM domain-containing protein [Methanobrevibacter sp.]MBE6498916.1 SPASM domain-containing protein [Methanobrevibacter sp.]
MLQESSVLDVISEYLKKNTDRKVQIGLFGGEPLLVENYSLITKIFDFCVAKKISIGITTNGKNLDHYLKLLIIYRSLGITVCSTIDSIEDNEFTRTPVQLSKLHQNVTNELLSNVKLLIDNGVHVDLETNIDSHNIRKIGSIIDYYRNNGYLDNPFFTFGFGRVDDRFYETNYSRIVSYVDILTELSNINSVPSKMYISFLRSAYELARKIGMNYGQTELKIPGTYCWASSPLDTVFYVDPDLKTYRCTYTVGRSNYSIMDFTFDNIEKYQLKKITSDDYNNCKSCPIAGYCAGGCKLSADIDFNRQCKDEKEQFYRFLHEIYYPKLLQLLYKRINK